MFDLAFIVAVITWTVTHEGIFKEWQDYTKHLTNAPTKPFWLRKLAYPWTCEFCFSFWVALLVMFAYDWHLTGWSVFVLGYFRTIAYANLMMAFWFIVRLFIRWLGHQSEA